jgi:hypothetical protein
MTAFIPRCRAWLEGLWSAFANIINYRERHSETSMQLLHAGMFAVPRKEIDFG